MAPNRKKARLTRMDAAVDQMGLFGFQSKLVRNTVRSLLKVYGNDGWPFIEENAYKILIDTLLEEQAEATNNLLEDASGDRVVDEDASITHNAESSEPQPLSIKGPVLQDCNLVKRVLRSSSSKNIHDLCANKINLPNRENTSRTLCVYTRRKQKEEAQNLLKDASLTHNAESSESSLLSIKGPVLQERVLGKTALHSSSSDNVDDHSANEVSLQNYASTSRSLCASDAVPIRRVKEPCYGWISDTDDDDEDDGDDKFLN